MAENAGSNPAPATNIVKYNIMGKNITEQVKAVLEEYPLTRNSDIALYKQIIREFYKDRIVKGANGGDMIYLDKLEVFPPYSSIIRTRAKFQMKNLYNPDDVVVAKRRGFTITPD